MSLTGNEQAVYSYLQNYAFWTSPTLIGMEVGDKKYTSASSWASPICKRLVEKGYAERNKKGLYRAK